jgi:tRNA A-37 threonylcarbamoyl transferase component Bud32
MGYWMVEGLHAVPRTRPSNGEFIKEHMNPVQFKTESELLAIARAAGCAPEFEIEPPMTIRLRRHVTLTEWVQTDRADLKAMGLLVLEQIHKLHAAGVCHRDLKLSEIVVDGDRPLLIDFDLSTEASPEQPCYDLLGPASGVPLPPIHACVGITQGVWWDTAAPQIGNPLWRLFGPLKTIS